MSGSATVFNAAIVGQDRTASAFAAIAKSFRGMIAATKGLTAATKGLNKEAAEGATAQRRFIATLGAHVRLLHGHLGSVNAGLVGIRKSLSEFLPMLGGLGAGASLVGLFALTKSVAEARVETDALLVKLGISGKAWGGLSYAAKISAVPVEAMSGGIEKLNRTMGMMGAGRNKTAVELFKHLKISLRDDNKHIRSAADVLPQLADAFMRTKDSATRAFMATTLFGKAGQDLRPILERGGEALRKLAEEGARLVYVPSEDLKKAMHEFEDNWIGLEGAMKGFKTEIGANLAPVFAPLIAMAKEWVLANRHWIATGIADKVRLLSEWIKKVDIDDVVRQMTDWVRGTIDVINSIGGLKIVLGAVMLMMGSPLLSAITSVITIFASLGRALLAVSTIMWANPIVLAVAAVTAAAFLLWYKWDWVKTQVGAIFTWFSGQSAWVQALLAIVAPFIFVPMKIYQNWDPIRAFFQSLWSDVTAIFRSATADIQPMIDGLKSGLSWVENSRLGHFISGFQPGPSVAGAGDADPMMLLPMGDVGMPMFTLPPSLYREGGPAAGPAAPAQNGELRVKIDLSNLPPGTNVNTTSGGVARVETNVGYSSPMPRRD